MSDCPVCGNTVVIHPSRPATEFEPEDLAWWVCPECNTEDPGEPEQWSHFDVLDRQTRILGSKKIAQIVRQYLHEEGL